MSSKSDFDFDDIENNITDTDDEIEEEFIPPQKKEPEPKKEETLKKKKIESEKETEPENFSFKSNSDLKSNRSPTSDRNEKTMESLTKKIKEVNRGLETLDFEMQKFNRFSSNLKTFKIWNTVILSISSLAIGAILTFAIFNHFTKNENNEEIIKTLSDFQVRITKDSTGALQLYTEKSKAKTFTTPEFQVLEIQK
jgi:hypothetical protein